MKSTGSPRPAAAGPVHVAICIATYRRPEGLKRLLASLDGQTFTRAAVPRITVVVIDNDAGSQLGPEVAKWSRHRVRYRIEPRRGLAAVRNACLEAAPDDTTAIAFIDDDEWAEPQWLDALLAMQAECGVDVVQGPVRPQFARPAAEWLVRGRFNEVGPFVDGEELGHGATGNVLIMRSALTRTGARFHDGFDFSGGEDVDFFAQLLAKGCRIIAAAEAVAHESIPVERMTLGWVLKRQFRTGHTLGAISRRQGGRGARFAKALARGGLGSVQVIAVGPLSILIRGLRPMAVRGLANIAWGTGTLAAFAGVRVDHYAKR